MKAPFKNYTDVTDKPCKTWSVGLLFSTSDAFGDKPVWVDHRQRLTIKPGETGRTAYKRETGKQLPANHTIFEVDR